MKLFAQSACFVFLLSVATTTGVADDRQENEESIRILSWNISDDAFVAQQQAFKSVLTWANPDIVLLDEVAPSADPGKLSGALAVLPSPETVACWC
jgi:hypothetical protein